MTPHNIKSGLAVLALALACICLPGWVEADGPGPRIAPIVDKPPAAVTLCRKDLGEPELVSLGTFTAFAYCSCPQCCGRWSGGPTASGTMPEEGRTVAADWSVLPAGTEIYIAGLGWRVVEDTGSGIMGDKLDVYMESHEMALEFGVQEWEVFVKNEHDLQCPQGVRRLAGGSSDPGRDAAGGLRLRPSVPGGPKCTVGRGRAGIKRAAWGSSSPTSGKKTYLRSLWPI